MALVVILPGPEDFGAGQVVSALRRRGADAAVVPGAILEVSRWEHRVVGGRAETVITLPTGLQLSSASVGAVLNRLPGASVRRFARSSERDLYPPVTVPEPESGPVRVTDPSTPSRSTLTRDDVTLRA